MSASVAEKHYLKFSLQDYYDYAKKNIESDDLVLGDVLVRKEVGGAWVAAYVWVSDDDILIEEFKSGIK